MARKVKPFQITRDSSDAAKYGYTNEVLEFGPRYSPPVDNTLIMNIFHGTMDGGISILMDHEAVAKLLAWLSADVDFWLGTIEFPELQTSAELSRRVHSMTGEELVDVRIWWHGSKRARSYHLTPRQREAVVEFLQEALAGRWEGWLSPEDVPMAYHGHVTTNGVKAPCKLCDLRAVKA
jgi:hypothetical protein